MTPLVFRHRFELVLLRHGRTAWNAGGRFQGQTDVPLDETGREQARGLRVLLDGVDFERAVSSDLCRARETAEIVLGQRPTALELDPRWREMEFGVWEGLTWSEIVECTPAMAGRSAVKPKDFVPAGGESFEALCERIAEALLALDARCIDGDRVLVATHAGPLHAVLQLALGESAAAALRVRFSPASMTRLALGGAPAEILELNRTARESNSLGTAGRETEIA